MKIATFNINNVNKRLTNLQAWLAEARPEVVCLQELKAEDRAFPQNAIREAGYGAVWHGQRTWNGVAILARGTDPILTCKGLPASGSDTQARYIEAAVNGVLIASIYLPNGNPNPGPKFEYKLAWFEGLIERAAELIESRAPVVLAGDFNVVPTEADIYQPNHWRGDALVDPKARFAFRRLLEQGWTDTLRAVHPEGPLWPFWAYLRNRWPTDKRLRLDHLLVSPTLADTVADAGVDRYVRGREGASDHAPAWIMLNPRHARKTPSVRKTGRAR